MISVFVKKEFEFISIVIVKQQQNFKKEKKLIFKMGTALLTIKIMPTSPEVNLEEIKEKAQVVVEEGKGRKCRFEEEPIAFGLKAVMVFFDIDEEQELEPIEQGLRKIQNVSSAEVTDMRRAFG